TCADQPVRVPQSTSIDTVLFLISRRPPRSPLFPYTTLFRSSLSFVFFCSASTSVNWSGLIRPSARMKSERRRPTCVWLSVVAARSEEHTSELQSRFDLVCRLLLEKKKQMQSSRRLGA